MHDMHCHIIWSSAPLTYTSRLIVLQKKVIRIIYNASPLAHTQNLFHESKIIVFQELFQYLGSLFLHKLNCRIFPTAFSSSFPLPFRHSTAQTRSTAIQYMQIERHRTQLRANSPRIRLSHLYNNFFLPLSLHLSNSIFTLRKSLKSILC